MSLGFKVGSPVNDPASQTSLLSTFAQSRWTGGPTVELRLPLRFSLEFDALRWANRTNGSYSFRFAPDLSAYSIQTSQKTSAWDLPLLLKYRLPFRSIRPFVTAGYLFTHESTERVVNYQCAGPQGSCLPGDYPASELRGGFFTQSGFRSGPSAGAGVDFRMRYLTISPELRFSRLINAYPRDNRFTAMVGFTFGRKR